MTNTRLSRCANQPMDVILLISTNYLTGKSFKLGQSAFVHRNSSFKYVVIYRCGDGATLSFSTIVL